MIRNCPSCWCRNPSCLVSYGMGMRRCPVEQGVSKTWLPDSWKVQEIWVKKTNEKNSTSTVVVSRSTARYQYMRNSSGAGFRAGLSGQFFFLTLPCRLPRTPTGNPTGIVQAAMALFNGSFVQK